MQNGADMATQSVEKELLELEKQYWRALRDRDVEAALRLTDETVIVAGAQGVGRLGKQAMAAMLKSATWTLRSFEVKDDALVQLLSDDVAIVAYTVHEELTVEGKPVVLDAADASIWVRRDGRWLCALHTEAIAGDPYGRDRRAVAS
jgi:ketosteroid isomerase-like protein